jgi:AAA-like domain
VRIPFVHLAGHLAWSVHGQVWAVWRVELERGRYVTDAVREELVGRVAGLARSLSGTPRVYGLCSRLDAAEVAEQMVAGLDWEALPYWNQTTEATLNLLDGQEMHTRSVWLAVPLKEPGSRSELAATASALRAELAGALGLPPAVVSEQEVKTYGDVASRLRADLGGGLRLRPATPAEVVWMVQHTICRGLEEPLLADAETSPLYGGEVRGDRLVSPSYADIGPVRLAEGGKPEEAPQRGDGQDETAAEPAPWWRSMTRRSSKGSLIARRWLQVESDYGTGYQAHLVISQIPPAIDAAGADVLAQLDYLPFPTDFVLDLQIVTAERAREQIERKKRMLLDQADQYGAQPTGMPSSIPSAAGDLEEEESRLSRTSVEVEIQSVTVLTVWAQTPMECEQRARALAAALAGGDYRTARPVGLQAKLFALGLPCSPRPGEIREFAQHHLSEDWAAAGALTGGTAGDPSGMLLGVDLDCATIRPILINVANAPLEHASASVGIVGDLGGGKSVIQKMIAISVVDRGGRAVVIDRTQRREWAEFAQTAAEGRSQIVDAAQARISIDPLRIFPPQIGASYALSYLALQTGIGPITAMGAALHHAVQAAAASATPSMSAVLQALQSLADDPQAPESRRSSAAEVADRLTVVATHPLAAMVFDPSLPAVSLDSDLGADFVVITTAGLVLPPREAFAQPEVMREQTVEALIGRAVLYLIAALARQVAFSDPNQFVAVGIDECYWLTSSVEGSALVHEILHDGRKHGAGAILGAPDVLELGEDRGLLAYKAVTRTTDTERAKRALSYLELDPGDEHLLRQVTTGLSPVGSAGREGEILLRDPRRNVAHVKVLIPPLKRINDGIHSTPGTKSAPTGQSARTVRGDLTPAPARGVLTKGGRR